MEKNKKSTTSKYIKPIGVDKRIEKFIDSIDEKDKIVYYDDTIEHTSDILNYLKNKYPNYRLISNILSPQNIKNIIDSIYKNKKIIYWKYDSFDPVIKTPDNISLPYFGKYKSFESEFKLLYSDYTILPDFTKPEELKKYIYSIDDSSKTIYLEEGIYIPYLLKDKYFKILYPSYKVESKYNIKSVLDKDADLIDEKNKIFYYKGPGRVWWVERFVHKFYPFYKTIRSYSNKDSLLEHKKHMDVHITINNNELVYNATIDCLADLYVLERFYKNYTVSVNGSVKISNLNLSVIPIKFKVVKGSFYCSGNKLTNLLNSPEEVGFAFDCSNNQLKTLKGCLVSNVEEFDCSFNSLTSLEGCPGIVRKNLDCSHNKLQSLQYCPQKKLEIFNCSFNELTNLEYLPTRLQSLICNNNLLELSNEEIKELYKVKRNVW